MISTPTIVTARRTPSDRQLGRLHREVIRYGPATVRLYWFGPFFASITTQRKATQ